MKIGPENPCLGCAVRLPNNQVVRAPCCWKLVALILSTRHYQAYFAGKPAVKVVRQNYDHWMGEEVVVSMAGPCVNLDTVTGACLIEADKPLSCRDLQPQIDPLCVRTPTNSHHSYYINLEDVG